MTFANEKKTYLSKRDKSKKGDLDEKILPLLEILNSKEAYYTTSSCSGRVYLWWGSGKKNETQWLKMSHGPVAEDFFKLEDNPAGLVWLRLEPLILHVACRDGESANKLLEKARRFYKKSCLFGLSPKILVEIRGSEFIEMPLYRGGELLFSGGLGFLAEVINQRFQRMSAKREGFLLSIKKIKEGKIKCTKKITPYFSMEAFLARKNAKHFLCKKFPWNFFAS